MTAAQRLTGAFGWQFTLLVGSGETINGTHGEEVEDKAMNCFCRHLHRQFQNHSQQLTSLRFSSWEYKHIRLDYKGRGITQEINTLDIDGTRYPRGIWTTASADTNEQPPLPEMFRELGEQGWEMVSHVVDWSTKPTAWTFHE